MIVKVLHNKEYAALAKHQVKEQLMVLVGLVDEFSLTANIKQITFDPDLPDSMKKTFSQFTLFTLANYTFESIILNEKSISFEAGFGTENFGSLVTIPFEAIFQIIVDDSVLFVNPSASVLQEIQEEKQENDQQERSKNAFTLNPHNKRFLD